MEAVRDGHMSVREAAKHFEVPRSTLQDKLNMAHPKNDGGPTVLSEEEEKRIVAMMLLMSEWGFPWTSSDLCHFVKAYLTRGGWSPALRTHTQVYESFKKIFSRSIGITLCFLQL